MSDELPKKVFSVPPPPTDEIDSEWGGKGADESGKNAQLTATAAAEAGKAAPPDVPPGPAAEQLKAELAGQNETPAAPGTPPPASHHAEEEDDEDEDDDDDDDDDDDAHAVARGGHAPTAKEAASDDWLPDWAPFAVLGLLVVVGIIGGLGAFTTPSEGGEGSAEHAPAATGAAEAAEPTSVEASHFLVMYKGSTRAPENVTRTKEEAKKRAEEGLAKAKKGDFAKVVAEYTDEPGGAARAGTLGSFTRESMVKPFSDAAFKLKVGQLSGLVETPFGYHVIKRTK